MRNRIAHNIEYYSEKIEERERSLQGFSENQEKLVKDRTHREMLRRLHFKTDRQDRTVEFDCEIPRQTSPG